MCDYKTKQFQIRNTSLKLHPHQKLVLLSCNKAIHVIINGNKVEIVKTEETQLGVFIGTQG